MTDSTRSSATDRPPAGADNPERAGIERVGIERVGVVGAGLMGHALAALFAAGGCEVVLVEPAAEVRRSAPARIVATLASIGGGAELLERITLAERLDPALERAEVVIEAVREDLALKREVFSELDALLPPPVILASNTSALPITSIATAAKSPARVVGTHFWNPPHLVPLVEVVQSELTSLETVARTMELMAAVGKSPVHVRRDVPGFIGNRLQHALKREAIAIVEAGICDAETVDTVVKDGFGARLGVLGPLEQSDLVGLDLTLAIHETIIPALDRSAEPSALLRRLVAEGKIGMRTGEGFRSWTPEQADAVRERLSRTLVEQAAARRAAAGS